MVGTREGEGVVVEMAKAKDSQTTGLAITTTIRLSSMEWMSQTPLVTLPARNGKTCILMETETTSLMQGKG
eukprot:5374871-Ditylum_brightwellii.AAC.1